jgi:hypothetical protein
LGDLRESPLFDELSRQLGGLHEQSWGSRQFSRINAGLCAGLQALLGLVFGVALVAGEIPQDTNRLAWTQSITRTRWLLIKVGVVGLFIAVLVGALVPLFWWWADSAQRASHIQPANFDSSGFVVVAYALSAFVLGVLLGAMIRRSGWAFAVAVPIYALLRVGVQLYLRPNLIAPVVETTDAFRVSHQDWWYLNGGFVPNGRSTPAPGQSWSSFNSLMENCPGDAGYGKPVHSEAYCEKLHHVHNVLEFQPPSHFRPLEAAESAIFLGIAAALLGLTVLVSSSRQLGADDPHCR